MCYILYFGPCGPSGAFHGGVTINGTYPNQKLIGFMLVAVPLNAKDDESTAMGVFQPALNEAIITSFILPYVGEVLKTLKRPRVFPMAESFLCDEIDILHSALKSRQLQTVFAHFRASTPKHIER
ncbi:hypothetical protein CAPTEDRAFT_218431 [Capitella teleta]|uniref:Uncharacterized protein n=1 Tax=Capitella teleta TaxID=283909 RepID=R7VIQ8_CAPTE|nr:hypothetical protein CAPTEDRAFT_218431 [Capitella teleta]|eukprot:ELU18708.1 hypothetical protein CAPTEDRAFT_218431 [Capitella teleta]